MLEGENTNTLSEFVSVISESMKITDYYTNFNTLTTLKLYLVTCFSNNNKKLMTKFGNGQ